MDKYSAWWKNKMKEEKGKKSRLREKGFVRAYSSGGVVHQSREDSVARAGNWFYVYTQEGERRYRKYTSFRAHPSPSFL